MCRVIVQYVKYVVVVVVVCRLGVILVVLEIDYVEMY
jgi:hypothetical protein